MVGGLDWDRRLDEGVANVAVGIDVLSDHQGYGKVTLGETNRPDSSHLWSWSVVVGSVTTEEKWFPVHDGDM